MKLKIAKILGLLALAVWGTYFAPKLVASGIYIMTLIAYLNSKDEEPFWLVFFLVLSDGFIGFFNYYEAVISVIPGLPPIEVGHFYIILTGVKLLKVKERVKPFYDPLLTVLLIYLVFLVVQGYMMGVTNQMNVHFRIIKFILPLMLFYTIPRLFGSEDKFREFFALCIPFAFIALFAQVFTIATGFAPSQALGVNQELWFTEVLKKGATYRGFYSTMMVLISFFGALYYTTVKDDYFSKPLLYAVLAANFLSAFISATRGWVLCFSIVLVLHMIFILRMDLRRIALIVLLGAGLIAAMMEIPTVEKQFSSATERIFTLGKLAKGDVSAVHLERLDKRAPRVIKKWLESPLTGWGFSDDFFKYGDNHVGNHNILIHSGVAGALLMLLFFGYFFSKLILRDFDLSKSHAMKSALLVFPVFFLGWFIIHSTSGQHFHYYASPAGAMVQAVFFSFGAMMYQKTFAQAS